MYGIGANTDYFNPGEDPSLGEVDYRGPLVFEVHPGTAAKKGWDACGRRLEKSINFIKGLCAVSHARGNKDR